jgi:2-amino-4-hydroxy-6-hydroxymethyldihydropteridine diphosphokinase
MARCLIGCGSNQGRRREHLDHAVELLRFMPGVTVLAVSRPVETRAVGGPPGQPAFLNGACLLETELPPHDVLEMLLAVENTLHRERAERWGPRTIDLDLLLYDDVVLDSAALTLPHPRMATRRFVLEPCAEIAGDLVHPRSGCSVRDLLTNLSQPCPHVAVVGVPGAGAAEVAAAVADAMLARLVRNPAPLSLQLLESRFGVDADDSTRFESDWIVPLAARARPLDASQWPREPHTTVCDYWLETQRLAAVDVLPRPALDRFQEAFTRHEAATVAPNVVILLISRPDVLEERIAFRNRQPPPRTDLFADVGPASAVTCHVSPTAVQSLMQLQERLVERLHLPHGERRAAPRATIAIDASDLGQAANEAVAAVEAMAR